MNKQKATLIAIAALASVTLGQTALADDSGTYSPAIFGAQQTAAMSAESKTFDAIATAPINALQDMLKKGPLNNPQDSNPLMPHGFQNSLPPSENNNNNDKSENPAPPPSSGKQKSSGWDYKL